MKKLNILLFIGMSLLISGVMSGCTFMKMLEHGTMQEPSLEFQDYEVADIDLERVLIRLHFKAKNPNEHNIDTFFTDYEFFIGEKSIVQGKDLRVTLIPQGESIVVVPVELAYSKLFDTAGTLASLIGEGKKTVDSRVHIRIHGEFLLYEFFSKRHTRDYSYEVDVDTEIPLPEITVETVKETVSATVSNILGIELFAKPDAAEEMAKLRNSDNQMSLFYNFHFFSFDAAYDSTRAKELVPDVEKYDNLIYFGGVRQ